MSSAPEAPLCVTLFYCYTSISNVSTFAHSQRVLLQSHSLSGRVRVAAEGINGTVCGAPSSVLAYEAATRAALGAGGAGVDFKRSPAWAPAFPGAVVREVGEIVTLGLGAGEAAAASFDRAARRLRPEEFRRRLGARKLGLGSGTVVVDVRNGYESDIGHFVGALRPDVRQFSEFPRWAGEMREVLVGAEEVLLYCTGGVRCERASAYLIEVVGVERKRVGQLEGGIVRYLEEFGDGGGQWRGKNLTFDGRLAVQGTGEVVGRCCGCGGMWDDYGRGERCGYCRRRMLVCERCEAPRLCDGCGKFYEEERGRLEASAMTAGVGKVGDKRRLEKMEAVLKRCGAALGQ